MCELNKPFNGKYFIGYKYALRRLNKYYSPAIGIEYVSGEAIQIPESQDCLDTAFSSDILRPQKPYYSRKMIGRTAAFKDLTAARTFMDSHRGNIRKSYTQVILKVRLSKELIEGVYNCNRVVAGKKITILEEINV